MDANQENQQYDVIIVGGGPAGTTAAIYTSRAGLSTLVIDKGLTAGALGITSRIANYPGITEEISGAELLGRMRTQAKTFGAHYLFDRVIGVDFSGSEKMIFGNTDTYTSKAVILATGSMGRGNRVKGEDDLLGRGVSYCATCDAAFFRGQVVAVAGNSDEAVEEALYLAKFVKTVHFLSPTPEVNVSHEQAEELIHHPGVVYHPGTVLREIMGVEKVTGVKVGIRGEGEKEIQVSGAFIYLQGGKPVTEFLLGQLPIDGQGYLVVDDEYRTSIEGVYAVGDMVHHQVKQAVVAAAQGAVAGMAVEKYLRNRKSIQPDWAK